MRPDFSKIDYKPAADGAPQAAPAGSEWFAPEHITIQPWFTRADLEGMQHLAYAAGLPPYLRGPYSTMYSRQPWTIRQYAGFSTAEESNAFYRRNLAAGQKGLSVAFDLAHSPRLRFRPRAGGRRCRQGRRGHRFRLGHEDPVRPDSARPDVRIHDHERRGTAYHGVLHRGRRRTGRHRRRSSAAPFRTTF